MMRSIITRTSLGRTKINNTDSLVTNLLEKKWFSSFRHDNHNSTTIGSIPSRIHGTIPVGGQGLAVGQYAETERSFDASQVAQFASLVDDFNPLHTSWEMDALPDALKDHPLAVVSANKPIDDNGNRDGPSVTQPVVHGILVSSLFSSIFGTLIPGCVYLEQSLSFRRPVFVNDVIVGRVQIETIENRRRQEGYVLRCQTQVLKRGKECIQGDAEVWVLNGTLETKSASH